MKNSHVSCIWSRRFLFSLKYANQIPCRFCANASKLQDVHTDETKSRSAVSNSETRAKDEKLKNILAGIKLKRTPLDKIIQTPSEQKTDQKATGNEKFVHHAKVQARKEAVRASKAFKESKGIGLKTIQNDLARMCEVALGANDNVEKNLSIETEDNEFNIQENQDNYDEVYDQVDQTSWSLNAEQHNARVEKSKLPETLDPEVLRQSQEEPSKLPEMLDPEVLRQSQEDKQTKKLDEPTLSSMLESTLLNRSKITMSNENSLANFLKPEDFPKIKSKPSGRKINEKNKVEQESRETGPSTENWSLMLALAEHQNRIQGLQQPEDVLKEARNQKRQTKKDRARSEALFKSSQQHGSVDSGRKPQTTGKYGTRFTDSGEEQQTTGKYGARFTNESADEYMHSPQSVPDSALNLRELMEQMPVKKNERTKKSPTALDQDFSGLQAEIEEKFTGKYGVYDQVDQTSWSLNTEQHNARVEQSKLAEMPDPEVLRQSQEEQSKLAKMLDPEVLRQSQEDKQTEKFDEPTLSSMLESTLLKRSKIARFDKSADEYMHSSQTVPESALNLRELMEQMPVKNERTEKSPTGLDQDFSSLQAEIEEKFTGKYGANFTESARFDKSADEYMQSPGIVPESPLSLRDLMEQMPVKKIEMTERQSTLLDRDFSGLQAEIEEKLSLRGSKQQRSEEYMQQFLDEQDDSFIDGMDFDNENFSGYRRAFGSESRRGGDFMQRDRSYSDNVNPFYGRERLNIFDPSFMQKQSERDSLELETSAQTSDNLQSAWNVLMHKDITTLFETPTRNGFEEMIKLTNQGKLWKFPIENEQGLAEEDNVPFHDHVFLEKFTKDFPKHPRIQTFMEVVCIGLSKNHKLTFTKKLAHLQMLKQYFEERFDLLKTSAEFEENEVIE